MFIFRLVKWFIGLVLLVVLLGAVLAGGYFYVDRAAKAAIERGGSHAMGVPTHLDSANLSFRRSELALQRLNVENPPGFTSPSFLELQSGEVGLNVRTLFRDRIVVPKVHLDGLVMHLEYQSGGSNYEIILENLEKLQESVEGYPKPGKTYVIEELIARDITVFAGARRLAFLRPLRVTIEELKLTDVGSDTEDGLLLGQVQGILVKAILHAVLRESGDILSGSVAAGLDAGPGPSPEVSGLRIQGLSAGDILNAPIQGLDHLFGDRD